MASVSASASRRAFTAIAGFIVFAVVYYIPHLAESNSLIDAPAGVKTLMAEASARLPVQLEFARNLIFGHLTPLLAWYAILGSLSYRFSIATGLRIELSRSIFFIAGWVVMVAGNRIVFPLSNYSMMFEATSGVVFCAAAGTVLVCGAIVALRNSIQTNRWVIPFSILGSCGLMFGMVLPNGIPSHKVMAPRNVIVIGVDSLSARMMQEEKRMLPNLARLLSSGTTFERAYTPLARTFPAWLSVLSGLFPVDHGAVFNLRRIDRIDRSDLVTHTLRKSGYRTVFAIDERRFANIDASFGFDRIVGPKIGALDFMLQSFNDTPLSNLLLQTRLGGVLFPYSWLNTASVVNYDGSGFVAQTVAALAGAPSVFLAVHFESAHYPYRTRHAVQRFVDSNRFRADHGTALTYVDEQVGKLISALRNKGYLEDALIIVLSDHGESFGGNEGEIDDHLGSRQISAYGHGADLLSEDQNRIVLGLVEFKAGYAKGGEGIRSDQISLTDLRRAIERYARFGDVHLSASHECMTVETGIRLAAAENFLTLDERELAREGASNYEIDASGRLRLRESILAAFVNSKDIGVRCRDRITHYSSAMDRYITYSIDPLGKRLTAIELANEDVEQIDAYRARLKMSITQKPQI